MRKVMVLAAVLGAASMAAADETDCRCAPTLEQISRFEERVADLPESIYTYARYYAGSLLPPVTFRGQTIIPRRIHAQFIPARQGLGSAIHIVERRNLPPLGDEACVANLDDPPQNDAFQLVVRCNRPGAWTPGAAEIAELERRIALPGGAAPLDKYARHYAGVTDSGVRLIRGVFLDVAGIVPGIVVASEIELPLATDSACRVVNIRYNPDTTQSSIRCNDPR